MFNTYVVRVDVLSGEVNDLVVYLTVTWYEETWSKVSEKFVYIESQKWS